MKSLILVCLIATAVLAAPQQQQQQNRRRLQSLSVQLVDDDGDKGKRDYRDREQKRQRDRYNDDRNRYNDNRNRYNDDRNRYNDDRNRYDDDRDDDPNRYDDDRVDDDRDRDGDDRDDVNDSDRRDYVNKEVNSNRAEREEDGSYRYDNEYEKPNNALRSTHLDALARQMDIVASQYGSQGRVKVAYVPPTQRGNSYSADLGALNFRYIPSRNREVQPAVRPLLYIRPEDTLAYNPYLGAQLRKQERQQQSIDDDSQD